MSALKAFGIIGTGGLGTAAFWRRCVYQDPEPSCAAQDRSPWSPTTSKFGVRVESNLYKDGAWSPNGVQIKRL
jgi:hypothetical protein